MTNEMPQDMAQKLRRSLILHEKYAKYPYIDSVGKITIGIGYNLTDRGIDDEWINKQYETDVAYFYEHLSQFPWFSALNDDRRIILVDMCFMGLKKFLSFTRLIEALERHDYTRASVEMLDSKWAEQVKGRAVLLAEAMRKGIYEV